MAENYKAAYLQVSRMLDHYQDVVVPGLMAQLEKRVEVVRCGECKHYNTTTQQSKKWVGTEPCCGRSCRIKMPSDGFCSYGERKDDA